jgi:hypothetical protein
MKDLSNEKLDLSLNAEEEETWYIRWLSVLTPTGVLLSFDKTWSA